MEDVLIPVAICGILFIGLPWIIFHYITQWKKTGTLSLEDERLLDELHDLARRLDDRMGTIERIVAADHPGFRPGLAREAPERLGTDFETIRSTERTTDPRAATDWRAGPQPQGRI